MSSGAGIVHSGGESLRTVTLADFLDSLRENDGGGESSTSFTFDLEFVDRNPGEQASTHARRERERERER